MSGQPESNPYLSPQSSLSDGRFFRKRYGCLAIFVLLSGTFAAILYNSQYVSRERGFRLEDYHAGAITWNAWSYGNWKTTHKGPVTIETYEPPYTLVLAMSPDAPAATKVEMLQVSLVDRDGTRTHALSKVDNRVEHVTLRPYASVRQPYAVFVFKNLLLTHSTVTLEIEAKITAHQSDKVVIQQITVPTYETERHSFTFWEAIMGI